MVYVACKLPEVTRLIHNVTNAKHILNKNLTARS